jgi:hypothetical protein
MEFKKNEILETLIKLAFIALLFVVVMLVSLGVELDFTRLADVDYWVQVSLKLVFTMIVFNMVCTSHVRTKSRNENSRFFLAYATNNMKIKEIQNNDLYDALTDAVKLENEDLYIKKCTSKLRNVSMRLTYEEVLENIDNLPELANKYKIVGKHYKKLEKVAYKVVSGKYHIKEVKDTMFLRDNELNYKDDSLITFSVVKDKVGGNISKVIIFMVVSMFLQILIYQFYMPDFWTWFITNLTLFIGAVVSGFFEANREIRLKTAMYEERNAFLKRRLNINVVYKGE